MTSLRIRPQADRDTDDAADVYAHEPNVDVALQFLAAADRACQSLVDQAHLGTAVKSLDPRLAGLRLLPVPGFESYLVLYVPTPAFIDVVRLLHGARDLPSLFPAD